MLVYVKNEHNIVNQLYSDKILKKEKDLIPLRA